MEDFKNRAMRHPFVGKARPRKLDIQYEKGKLKVFAKRPPQPSRKQTRPPSAVVHLATPRSFLQSGYKIVLGMATFGCAVWLLVGVMVQSVSFFQQLPPHQFYLKGYITLSPSRIYDAIGFRFDQKFNEINTHEVANRLNQHPKIAQVQIRRLFPDFLAISLKERHPHIFLKTAGFYYSVDEFFYPIEKTAIFENFDLPVFTGIDPSQIQLGRPIASNALQNAADFFDSIRQSSLDWKNIAELDVGDPLNLKIKLRTPAVLVQLGQGNFLEKMQTYEKIVTQLQQSGKPFHSVDLRYENKAIVQL